ncbi:MAG: hypothetical protein KGD61_10360 [Candidatus Lokiarchaeota archaeon]|nr:hypothetical protein [Candidatus Lokiarchaeota archaeon]
MRNYNKALIIVAALIVGGGVGFIITGFATAGSVENSFNFKYEPISPDPIEDLTFNVDIGTLLFKYNTSLTTSYAEIDVDIEISGLYMEGKTYLDFLHPKAEWWDNTTATFNLLTLPDVWFNPSHWFKSYNITVLVTLRTDVVYDLTALTGVGSIEMQVSNGVILNGTSLTSSTGSINFNAAGNNEFQGDFKLKTSTGSVQSFAVTTNFTHGYRASTSTGSIALNYTNCIMSNNIIGSTSTGSVTFKSYNMFYTTNSTINLETSTGSISSDLYQYIAMGANVSGTWKTSTGNVNVVYKDNLVDTGVRFIGSIGTGSINYSGTGMEITGLPNNIFSTVNYTDTTYRYLFSLDTSTGSINANAESA